MTTGTVKWFNVEKQFGFILSDNPPEDVFVHLSALRASGLTTLRDGQRVGFTVTVGKNGKKQASQVHALAEPDRVQSRDHNERTQKPFHQARAKSQLDRDDERIYRGAVGKHEIDEAFMRHWREISKWK